MGRCRLAWRLASEFGVPEWGVGGGGGGQAYICQRRCARGKQQRARKEATSAQLLILPLSGRLVQFQPLIRSVSVEDSAPKIGALSQAALAGSAGAPAGGLPLLLRAAVQTRTGEAAAAAGERAY